MQIPIRIIGIATSVFWIFIIIFSVTAVYSMKDFRMSFGEPQINTDGDGNTLFSLPVSIVNTGFYNMVGFNISTVVTTAEGATVTSGSTLIPVIARGKAVVTIHNMSLDLGAIMLNSQTLVLNDSQLTVAASLGMRAAAVVPVQVSSNFTIPWGAPMSNLSVGTPQSILYNATHVRVTVPVSFENHAFIEMVGGIIARMVDDNGHLIAEDYRIFSVPQHASYKSDSEIILPFSSPSRGRFELYVSTQYFDYGPVVTQYGS